MAENGQACDGDHRNDACLAFDGGMARQNRKLSFVGNLLRRDHVRFTGAGAAICPVETEASHQRRENFYVVSDGQNLGHCLPGGYPDPLGKSFSGGPYIQGSPSGLSSAGRNL